MKTTSEKALRRLIAIWTGAVVIIALLVAWELGGCAARVTTVTDLPAGVTQQQAQSWDSAVANLHKIAATTSTLRQAVIGLNRSGAFPDSPAYVKTLQVIANADVLELNAVNFLKKTPKEFGGTQRQFVDAQIRAMLTELNDINAEGLTGIKNPDAQKQVSSLLAEIIAGANLVLAL